MKTKKFLSLVLSAAMILGVAVPVAAEPVSAGQGVEAEQQPIVENSITSGYILSDLDYNTPVYEPDEAVPYSDDWGYSADETIENKYPANGVSDIKAKYPSVRNQNPLGTCWAFSSIGLAEFDLINDGAFDKNIDLSELHLAYYAYNSLLDPLGGTVGDYAKYYMNNTSVQYGYLNRGGNYLMAARRMGQWCGPVSESDVPYSKVASKGYTTSTIDTFLNTGLSDEYAYSKDKAHLENTYMINIKENASDVKKAIKKYGGPQESPVDELDITIGIFRNHLKMIDDLLLGFNASKFFTGEPLERLNCLNSAAEYVQSRKDTETRFMGLSRRLKSAYNICFPSGELTDEETAKAQFYLAIRSIIYKQTKGNAPDAEAMNQVVENMVREAIACTGIENVVDEHKSVDLFSDEFIEQLNTVKLPITKFNALLKLLRKAISAYGRTNKVKAMEFDERLRKVVDDYNSRDKLVFTNEVVSDFVNDLSDQLLQILRDLQEDQSSFQKMGISFEEKAFYDILVKVRDDHGFPYADEKCVVLAKKIKELVDDKAQFADWSTRDDIKNQLNMELTVLLYQNGYPPEWDEEVFEKVMEQAENFKKYAD